MSVTIDATVWCDADGCSEWTYGDGSNHTARAARKGARSLGWVRLGRQDLCPKHGAMHR